MKPPVQNRLAQIRKSRGVGAADLAKRIHVSRQTIYSIEAGSFVPNTEVALCLARELEVSVDEIFTLQPGAHAPATQSLAAEILSAAPPESGQLVRVCQVGARWMSVPASAAPYYMPDADGIVKRTARRNGRADLLVFAKPNASEKRLLLAGCDPASSLLAKMVEKTAGVDLVSAAASSRLALRWLKEGKVHIAGTHMEDPKTGEFNLPFIRKELPNEDLRVVTFARWEEGLVVAAGNPRNILGVDDLAANVQFVNREPGSGSRALLDKLLAKQGIESGQVRGYDQIANGHLAAAYAVFSHQADVCLATRSAAMTFGLSFIPLHSERYDLVIRRRSMELPAVQAFLDVLQRATLRRKLEVLAGYDTSETGTMVA